MWFYRIQQNVKSKDVQITWNTKVTYLKFLVAFIGVAACGTNQVWIAGFSLLVLVISLVIYLVKYGDMIQLLRELETRELIDYEGSKYSLKHPFVVTVPKKFLQVK